ncbi:MAG: hypothetical protein E7071_07015 [Bacteroidales bacterium]|nr:hypothetical protein [Bacteroidales bacterium]
MKIAGYMIKCNILFLFLLLCACGTDNNGLRNIAFENLVGVPSGCDYIVDYPQEMYVIDSLLILCDPSSNKGFVEVYNINTGEFRGALLTKGRGEFESLSPFVIGFSDNHDSLYVYDVAMNRLVVSNLVLYGDSLVAESYTQFSSDRGDVISSKLAKLANGYIVSMPYFAQDSMFVLYNSEMQFMQRFGIFPIQWEKDTDIKLYSTFVGDVKAYGNKVIYASGGLPYVVCYDIADDGSVTKCWEVMLDEYSIYFEDNKLKFSIDNPQTFMSVHPTADKIFIVYNGYTTDDWAHDIKKSMEYRVVVMNYDGAIIGAYELDYPIMKLAVYPEGDELFVFTSIDERMDIVKYRIN